MFGLEKPLIAIILVSFFLALVDVNQRGFSALTREEAVEISRNTWDVQEVFNWGYRVRYNLKVKYWDTTYIATVKRNHPGSDWEKNFPDDHGVWRVYWDIWVPGDIVVHYIDEFTGRIISVG